MACLLAVSFTSEALSGNQRRHGDRDHAAVVKPAQANYQDETAIVPTIDRPIPFSVQNFKTNVDVNCDRSVFEVNVPGLYSIDAFLILSIPSIGDTVDAYITINERKLLTFFSTETRTGSPIVNFHFNDRLVYLEKGDQVSVVVSAFTPGTKVLSRGFVMIALNNSN
jgi:hypothetical protein